MPRPLLLALLYVLTMVATAQADTIDWRVKHRFRLFNADDRTVAMEGQLLDALSRSPTILGAYGAYAKILRADGTPGQPQLYKFTHYQRTTSGRYDADYVTPKDQVITVRLTAPVDGGATCVWTVAGTGQTVTRPCASPADLSIPFGPSYVAEADVSVTAAGAAGSTSVSTHVRSRDRVVVSFGDSYAAGEGDPDKPADLSQVRLGTALRPTDWWNPSQQPSGGVLPPGASADWWSIECHRSLFSSHALAALKMAAQDAQDSVTFLSFACSGASVLDGLIASQFSPPGEARLAALNIDNVAFKSSQLDQAFFALCEAGFEDKPIALPDSLLNWQNIYYLPNKNPKAVLPNSPRCDRWKRQPDLILLSIGGNDIGFAGLGAWAVLPLDKGLVGQLINSNIATFAHNGWNKMSVVCPSIPFPLAGEAGAPDPRCAFPNTYGLLSARDLYRFDLPNLLDYAYKTLRDSQLAPSNRIVHVEYPSPLFDENMKPCGTKRGADYPGGEFATDADLQQPWMAQLSLLPTADIIQLGITAERSSAVKTVVFDGFLDTLRKKAEQNGAIFAAIGDAYDGHGICAGHGKGYLDTDFWFPKTTSWPVIFGVGLSGSNWDSRTGPPSRWDAYKSRQRWIRVANDSLLSETIADASGRITDESLSGTIHPTAEGYAAVADKIYAVIPATLKTPDLPSNSTQSGSP